jgi:hypothetical protein
MTQKRRASARDLKGSRLVFLIQATFLLVCLGLMRFI